jgi:hypothetical protein
MRLTVLCQHNSQPLQQPLLTTSATPLHSAPSSIADEDDAAVCHNVAVEQLSLQASIAEASESLANVSNPPPPQRRSNALAYTSLSPKTVLFQIFIIIHNPSALYLSGVRFNRRRRSCSAARAAGARQAHSLASRCAGSTVDSTGTTSLPGIIFCFVSFTSRSRD